MSYYFQSESLMDLSLQSAVKYILNKCYEINRLKATMMQEELIMHVRQVYRPFLFSQLPLIIRQKLLSKCLSDLMEGYMPINSNFSERNFAPVYLLNILLDEDIKELRLNLCCFGSCSHKNALFKTVANYGNGLNTLELINLTYIPISKMKKYFFILEHIFGGLFGYCSLTKIYLIFIISGPRTCLQSMLRE